MIDLNKIEDFKWSNLQVVETIIDIELTALKELRKKQEETLKQLKDDLISKLIEVNVISNPSDYPKSLYVSHRYDMDQTIINQIQIQQRYSTILLLYSFYEARLKHISELIKDEGLIDNTPGGDQPSHYYRYITKDFNVNKTSFESSYSKIDKIKEVRNSIAHREGVIKSKHKPDVMSLRGKGLITKEINGKLKIANIESRFLDFMFDEVEDFFEKILKAVDQKYEEKSN